MKEEKNALIQEQTGTRVPEWNSGGNVICCWYIEVFRIIRVGVPTSGDQARDLVSSLDAHVTQGGLCHRVLGIKIKGEDCVKCPDSMDLAR